MGLKFRQDNVEYFKKPNRIITLENDLKSEKEKNKKLEKELTDAQVALCDIYEKVI